jgi:hypothetical protein
MSKITLATLTSLANDVSATNSINNNNATISTAMDNTLSRDGTAPNTMLSDIDMNSHTLLNINGLDMHTSRITNLPAPLGLTEPLRMQELQNFIAGTVSLAAPATLITVTPVGNIASTNVQAALAELDTEKQVADPTLTSLATLDSTVGFVTETAADTFTKTSLVAPAAGITITNPAGTAGNPTFALANDLGAVEGLAGTGFATRTATDTWANRTIQQPAAGITITNPAGIAGDPTIALANDLGAVEGLATTGIVRRTATDTWSAGTLVTNAESANIAAHSYTGNNTGSSAPPADITNTQLTADLNVFTSTLQGVVPASGGGTSAFLRADATWAAPAGGGGGGNENLYFHAACGGF